MAGRGKKKPKKKRNKMKATVNNVDEGGDGAANMLAEVAEETEDDPLEEPVAAAKPSSNDEEYVYDGFRKEWGRFLSTINDEEFEFVNELVLREEEGVPDDPVQVNGRPEAIHTPGRPNDTPEVATTPLSPEAVAADRAEKSKKILDLKIMRLKTDVNRANGLLDSEALFNETFRAGVAGNYSMNRTSRFSVYKGRVRRSVLNWNPYYDMVIVKFLKMPVGVVGPPAPPDPYCFSCGETCTCPAAEPPEPEEDKSEQQVNVA